MKIQEVLHFIAPIDGWLSSHEGYFLYYQAKKTKGNIVEIGSWKGKSTICLAAGLSRNNMVFAIDPHKGEYSGKSGLGKKAPTFQAFQKNLKKVGLLKRVKPIIATSEDAAKKWKNSFDFLFIDGLHDYKHTYQDFSLWSPLLKKNGVIAFHDAFCGHNGPQRVVLEQILSSNKWSNIGVVGSIIFARKEKIKTFAQFIDKLRYALFIPMAIHLNEASGNNPLRFFLIHRVLKLLLLNTYTYRLLYEKI